MKNTHTLSKIISLLLLAIVISVPVAGNAQVKCTFFSDLEVGSVGEDVRCLQRYLNSSGYTISTIGAGSPGKETDTFQDKTKQALINWQIAKGVSPATGYFGPLSKAAYEFATSATVPVVTPVTTTPVTPVVTTPAPAQVVTVTSTERKVLNLLRDVRELIEDAEDDIEDAEDDGEDVSVSHNLLERAQDKFLDAIYAFIDGDTDDALELAEKAQDYAEDSVDDISGSEEDAEEAIQDAKNALADAREEINDADDDGDDVDDAQDLYDEAKDLYEEARDEFDEENYNKAKELAEEAEDLADDAIDAL